MFLNFFGISLSLLKFSSFESTSYICSIALSSVLPSLWLSSLSFDPNSIELDIALSETISIIGGLPYICTILIG